MEGIKSIEIEGEKIYLKKSKLYGWGVIYPWVNEDGSYNWFNLLTGGRWIKLISVTVIVIITVGYFFEYHRNLDLCSQLFNTLNITTEQAKYLNLTV